MKIKMGMKLIWGENRNGSDEATALSRNEIAIISFFPWS